MVNLANTETRLKALPQRTFRRETTAPRANTDRPDVEVNARLVGPNNSGAEELQKILGLVNDTAQGFIKDKVEEGNKAAAAQASIDFQTGKRDDKQFAKSYAYYEAWQKEGSKKLVQDVSAEVTDAVNARLNDDANPATIEELDGIVESVFHKHAVGEDGKPLNFGTPEATAILGNGFREVREHILGQAHDVIKAQTDARFLATKFHNYITEHERGSEIGAPPVPQTDPLAPLPEGQVAPPAGAPAAPRRVSVSRLEEPFEGFGAHITSRMGASREGGSKHNGEDFAVPDGTTIKAPTGGTVIASFSNARGGNQVRVKLDNGAIVGFAHLSDRKVQKGDRVDPGAVLGLSGHTGHATGPHVHMTVEVAGKKVSPSSYFKQHAGDTVQLAQDNTVDTSGPTLGDVPSGDKSGEAYYVKPFNVEGFMATLPPSVDRGAAKKFLIQSLINEAHDKGNSLLLAGLEDSVRADGTPSFTPTEVATILSARDAIAERSRTEAKRLETEAYEKNEDKILEAIIQNKAPSDAYIQQAALDGHIRDEWAFSILKQRENERKADQREARYEAEAGIDDNVNMMVGERMAGGVEGVSAESDKALLDSGQLGTGNKALARFKKLRTAHNAGITLLHNSPEYQGWASKLKANYKPKTDNSKHTLVEGALGAGGGADPTGEAMTAYSMMVAAFNQKVAAGEHPSAAYLYAVSTYGPKGRPDIERARQGRIAYLRQKRLNGGR